MPTSKKKKASPAPKSSGSPKIDPRALPLEPPTRSAQAKEPLAKSADRVHSEHFAPGRVCAALCQDRQCVTLIENTGYCRLFYIKNWQQIQRKRGVLKGGQLEKFIAEIASKYPDKYLEAIRADLGDVNSFRKVVSQLDLEAIDDEGVSTEEPGFDSLDQPVTAEIADDADET